MEPNCPFERRESGHRSGVPRACECGGYDFLNEDREQVQPFRRDVSYPYFGDIAAQRSREPLKTFLYQYGTAQEWSLRPVYDNMRGYYGTDYPTQVSEGLAYCGAPMSPFILLPVAFTRALCGHCEPEHGISRMANRITGPVTQAQLTIAYPRLLRLEVRTLGYDLQPCMFRLSPQTKREN